MDRLTFVSIRIDEMEDRDVAQALREIVEFHKKWPVIVKKPDFDMGYGPNPLSIDSMIMRMSMQVTWMTHEAYVAKFGLEAPTTPMLAAISRIWVDHPDYDPAWG